MFADFEDCSPATKITIPNKFTPLWLKKLLFLTVSINIGDLKENPVKRFHGTFFFQKTSICYLAFPDSNSGMKIHVSTRLVPCGSSSNCNNPLWKKCPTDYLENTTCYHMLSLDSLCGYNSFSDC